jgi:hypothetical protein
MAETVVIYVYYLFYWMFNKAIVDFDAAVLSKYLC